MWPLRKRHITEFIFCIVNIKYETLFIFVLGLARPWKFVRGSIWQGKLIVNLSSTFISKIYSMIFPSISSKLQVTEILSLWNDKDHGGVATRSDLIQILMGNQKKNSCQALISSLEKGKGIVWKQFEFILNYEFNVMNILKLNEITILIHII